MRQATKRVEAGDQCEGAVPMDFLELFRPGDEPLLELRGCGAKSGGHMKKATDIM